MIAPLPEHIEKFKHKEDLSDDFIYGGTTKSGNCYLLVTSKDIQLKTLLELRKMITGRINDLKQKAE